MDWEKLPDEKELNETVENLKSHGFEVFVVENKESALDKMKEIIPEGSKILNGSSTTLAEVGFVDLLKGEHKWKNLHEHILKESDYAKQSDLRRQGIVDADYFLGSVNAITEEGQLVACDASGSRVGAYPFSAKKLLLVVGTNKITKDLEHAMKRVREYVFPLEDERAKKAYGMGSSMNKWLIMEKDNPGRTTLVLVKEKL